MPVCRLHEDSRKFGNLRRHSTTSIAFETEL
jgi:hypothetical protein